MKTTMIAGVGLALIGGLIGVAGMHAGPGGHGPHGAEGAMMVPHMVAWLADEGLEGSTVSEAQRARIVAVKDRVLAQAETLHGAHETTHAEFKRQWDADKVDSARLHALVDARVEEMRRVLHTAVDGVVEIHDTLTAEQRRTVTSKVEAMHAGR